MLMYIKYIKYIKYAGWGIAVVLILILYGQHQKLNVLKEQVKLERQTCIANTEKQIAQVNADTLARLKKYQEYNEQSQWALQQYINQQNQSSSTYVQNLQNKQIEIIQQSQLAGQDGPVPPVLGDLFK